MPTKFIKLFKDKPGEPWELWYVLPTPSLQALVLKRLRKLFPQINYVCEWKDVNGFGLHTCHADWVAPGSCYFVTD